MVRAGASFNKQYGDFSAKIKLDTSIDAPTLLYAYSEGKGKPWYPNGYFVVAYGPDGQSVNGTTIATNHTNVHAFQITDKKLDG